MIVNLKFINYFNNKKILSKYSLQYIFRIFLFVERPYRFFLNVLFVTNWHTDTRSTQKHSSEPTKYFKHKKKKKMQVIIDKKKLFNRIWFIYTNPIDIKIKVRKTI